MSFIPSFGTSLLANPPIKKEPPTKVEDILNSTPAPQPVKRDSFEVTQPQPKRQKQGGGVVAPLLTTAVGLGGLFFFGRKGWLGKTIKTWFGGRLSTAKAHKKIAGQLQEYMSRYGSVSGVTIDKNVIKVEMESGKIREFKIIPKKNDTVIQLESTPSKNRREVINFRREDASPMHRVLFRLGKHGETKGYVSYKGGDILSKDFDEVSQMYKKSSTKIRPRLWLDFFKLGPVKTITKTRTFNTMEPEGFWAKVKDIFTDSSKNITKVRNKFFRGRQTSAKITNMAETRYYVYDKNGNISRVHVKPKAKGEKGYYEHYKYSPATTSDGKHIFLLTNIIRTSDKAGKKPL